LSQTQQVSYAFTGFDKPEISKVITTDNFQFLARQVGKDDFIFSRQDLCGIRWFLHGEHGQE
jgi:hypothetical protein